MSGNLRLSDPKSGSGDGGFVSPEEEELALKQEELARLKSELADAELELVTLRSELITFERRYTDIVGSRYVELDRLEALIAEAIARQHPEDPAAQEDAEAARVRAQESAAAMEDIDQAPTSTGQPSEELKRLYRQAAKEIHPDFATDERERKRREKVMAEVNRAFEAHDEEALEEMLRQWRSSPDRVQGEDTASRLVRVIRQIAQVRGRLRAIRTEMEELIDGQLYHLRKQVQEAASHGRELLAEMVEDVNARIESARERLRRIERGAAGHGN